MNLCIKIFRYAFLSIIVVPIWFVACVLGFISTILLHFSHIKMKNENEKYRNNMKTIYRDFKNNMLSIFFYY